MKHLTSLTAAAAIVLAGCATEPNAPVRVLSLGESVTDWSMVFNPAERTILFNMRNDMSTIYTLDLKKDLGW